MKIDENDLAKVIGKAIARRRRFCGMTQEEVAERLGIGGEAVSRMERGTVIPGLVRLFELAEVFGCHVGDLLEESSCRATEQSRLLDALMSKVDGDERRVMIAVMEALAGHFLR